MWILLYFTSLAIVFGVSRVPLLGSIVASFLFVFFRMGMAEGALDLQGGKSLEFEHLFKAFRKKNIGLLGVQVFSGFFSLFVVLGLSFTVFALIAGIAPVKEIADLIIFALQQKKLSPDQSHRLLELGMSLLPALWIAGMIAIFLATAGAMAVIFAPFLIYFQKRSVFQALKESFLGCLEHAWPLTVYSVAILFWGLLAVVPLFLGLIIFLPVFNLSLYCVYVDLFEKEKTS